MRVQLPDDVERQIRDHAAATYPNECCGALLGHSSSDAKKVTRVLRIDNARTDSAANRFLVTDRDYLRVEAQAAKEGVDLLGFYHSHPDHPASPSRYDLDHALPWFSYVILAVSKGRPELMTSWLLAEDRSRFMEEEIVGEPSTDPSHGGTR